MEDHLSFIPYPPLAEVDETQMALKFGYNYSYNKNVIPIMHVEEAKNLYERREHNT